MKIDFKNKVVLITGALGAIGRATALRFAENGADIALSDVDGTHSVNAIKEIEALGAGACFIKADLNDAGQASGIAQQVIGKFGKIDILINNAGTNVSAEGRRPIYEFLDSDWNNIFGVDLDGLYNCSKPVINHMMERKCGRIINIGSIAGIVPLRNQCAFVAAKAAVIALTKAMALELAPFGINVNAIAPGSIITEANKKFFFSDPARAESLLSHIPMHRTGDPCEITGAMLFLASDEASYMTVGIMVIDGGWTCGFTRDW